MFTADRHCHTSVLHRVKTKTSAKYGLEAQPRLVDIIAAVPPQYRRILVPKLKAKPIRTASGVRSCRVLTQRCYLPLHGEIFYRPQFV